MLRFAPSPTGDMHMGSLRVALLNYIVSKQKKEDFIVRIEDTDKEKNIEGKDQEILDILALFNIQYTQVIYQSENVRFHSAMALQLMHEKKAFSCFCSNEWIEKKKQEAKVAKKVYSYDDACRHLPAELVIDNTNPFSIRIVKPDKTIIVHDKIKGDLNFEPNTVDSFMIMYQDKKPTYNFACAIDDMLSDISLIIRCEEHLDNTPKQEHIRASLNYEKKVEYAHLPSLLNDTFSIKYLLEEGYLPEAILNYLIALGNTTPKEIFTLEEAIEWFDISQVSNKSIIFDINILKNINKEYLKSLDVKELSRYVGFADTEIGELARIYLEEVGTTKELKAKINPIFNEKREIPKVLVPQITLMTASIKKAPYFEEYDAFKNYILNESSFEEENFDKLLRLLLTNAEDGPDIAKVYKYLKNYIGEIVK
jgi:glutamyl-tRNA synthetase